MIDNLLFRNFCDDDFKNGVFNFISNSWIKNLDIPIKLFTKDERRKHISEIIAKLIVLEETVICCNPECIEQIYGWICGNGDSCILHMQYTKDVFRGIGIAKKLRQQLDLDLGRILISHNPKNFKQIARNLEDHGITLVYNPYVLVKEL